MKDKIIVITSGIDPKLLKTAIKELNDMKVSRKLTYNIVNVVGSAEKFLRVIEELPPDLELPKSTKKCLTHLNKLIEDRRFYEKQVIEKDKKGKVMMDYIVDYIIKYPAFNNKAIALRLYESGEFPDATYQSIFYYMQHYSYAIRKALRRMGWESAIDYRQVSKRHNEYKVPVALGTKIPKKNAADRVGENLNLDEGVWK